VKTDHGRSSDFRALGQRIGRRSTQRRFPIRCFASLDQCQWRFSFPVTAAGQLRSLTGFPLRSSCWARHRDGTQDMGFAALRQLFV